MLPELGDVGRLLVEAMQISMKDFEKASWEMYAGECKGSPFTKEQAAKGKAFLKNWCEEWGYETGKREGDVPQEVDIRLLQAFLQAAGDPDAEALDAYAKGVYTGHNRCMPRTPAVFEMEKNAGSTTNLPAKSGRIGLEIIRQRPSMPKHAKRRFRKTWIQSIKG